MKFILDEQTGTAYYYFNSTDEVGFIPMMIPDENGVSVLDTDEGGIVTDWQDEATEKRIRALLDK